jgi:exoribonuclease R
MDNNITTFKINVLDRQYNDFNIINLNIGEKIDIKIDPVKNKLFDQDIFKINNDVEIQHSLVRSMVNIPAIIVLEGNRVYGKTKKGRPLYRCIPDNRNLPEFLVPYTMKARFNKKNDNKYVLFKFNNWNNKHPEGRLVNVIGCVSILENFYEYQLYCKDLFISIQNFTKKTRSKLKSQSEDYYIDKIMTEYDIEDRRELDIISIDPSDSKDFDDAFGLQDLNDDRMLLSIYIANVSLWIEILDLWEYFSERISTIYLPNGKKPMLPNILSDSLCSLQENKTRFAFTLDIHICKKTFEIIEINYVNSSIIVKKNLRYETSEMFENNIFKKSIELVKKLNKKRCYVEQINSGHDLVAYLMILMNYQTAKKFVDLKTGIFRAVKTDKTYIVPKNIPENVSKFLRTWNSFGGSYVKFSNLESHDILDFDAYIHITSPIRRLVDLLNIIEFQDKTKLFSYSEKSLKFYEKWMSDESFQYINTTMRSIRKVQNDCSLLKMCSTDKMIMNELHDGFIFDKTQKEDLLFKYMVYIPKLKMVNRFMTRHDIQNNSKHEFRLFTFKDEDKLKEKIRIELIQDIDNL